MGLFIRLQVIHLHVDTELFVAVEFTVQARHDLGRAQHELTAANLLGWHMLKFGAIGDDQGAGLQLVVLEPRNLQARVHHAGSEPRPDLLLCASR